MPRVLFPNLLFEDELDYRVSRVSAAARRVVAELGPLMGLLSASGASDDFVVVPDNGAPEDLPPALENVRFITATTVRRHGPVLAEFCPWGWSHEAVQFGRRMGLDFVAPDPDVVRQVNSREFLAPFDDCVDGTSTTGSFGTLCRSIDEVKEALSQFEADGHTDWVIKSSLSHAARSRLTSKELMHRTEVQPWLRSRFDAGQAVYAEPWVERLAECGLQFSVPPQSAADAAVQFEGATEMLTDETGRYLGSVLPATTEAREPEWWQPAVERCRNIAEQARQLGFFGALGFDCMATRQPSDRRVCLRRCHDINGRITMGRIALSLRHYLRAGEFGIWFHCTRKPQDSFEYLLSVAEHTGIRIVPTSAGRVGGLPVKHRTALLISDNRMPLIAAVRHLFGAQTRAPFAMP